ncbi:MAG TPA: DUF2800 domain-containing protein [Verrucomicrobiota bacterium]|nr:DUF2800 domain-containing protein [Verrucomicrobiota bacterium]HNS69023.1 DUF2800 domain-containing protein [Verrucomicrobiota bacterium]
MNKIKKAKAKKNQEASAENFLERQMAGYINPTRTVAEPMPADVTPVEPVTPVTPEPQPRKSEAEPESKPAPAFDEREGWTSASNAAADALCPGRHLLQKQAPEEPKSEAATFGEQIHEALATGSFDSLSIEQQRIAGMCADLVRKLEHDYFGDVEVNRIVEERFWCRVDGRMRHSARVDLVLVHKDKALIVDYKTLAGEVGSIEVNAQLRDEAVLVARNLLLNQIGAAVVQPLVTMSPVIAEYNKEHITQAEAEMFERVRRCNAPDAPRVAGRVQCKWCRAKSICPEYREYIGQNLPHPSLSQIASVEVDKWTPEQRAIFCRTYPVALEWIETVKKQMVAVMQLDPQAVPGYELKERAGRTVVTDNAAAFERLIKAGVNTDEAIKTVTISKTGIEKLLKTASGLKGKALDDAVNELLDGISEKQSSSLTIQAVK